MVTAEFAVALPALVAVCALVAGIGQAGAAKVQACDAARAAARAVSIGEPAPRSAWSARISVATGSSGEGVTATAHAALVGPITRFTPQVTCEAWALREDSEATP